MPHIKDYVNIAEHCQRNWDQTTPVSDDIIKAVVTSATNMPTKQNLEYYSLVVVQDHMIRKEINRLSVAPNDRKSVFINTQMSAPVLLLWIGHNYKKKYWPKVKEDDTKENAIKNTFTAIGISSGAAALTAVEHGLKTGFCSCFHPDMDKYLKKHVTGRANGIDAKLHVALGIGYPAKGHPYNRVFLENMYVDKESHTKNIEVKYIKQNHNFA